MVQEITELFWKSAKNLKFNDTIEPDSEFFVDTSNVRGDVSMKPLLKMIGINPADNKMMFVPEKKYIAFCGHRGCGKSTELRKLSQKLNGDKLFFVVFVDALSELDINNCGYSDILMALAKQLLEQLDENRISIDSVFLSKLEDWFAERIERHEATKDFAAEIKAGVEGKTGIPLLGSIFSKITTSFKTNSTYKDELRKIIKNSFSEFAEAFNQLIQATEQIIADSNKGKKLLFIVDGTDRLNGAAAKNFFIDDSYQLQLIDANFIYCASIHLQYEEAGLRQIFDYFTLPMIKLREKNNSERIEPSYKILRKIIYKRINKDLFDKLDTVDFLIEHSGGNTRDLIKLLNYSFLSSDNDKYDRVAAEKAVKQLATEYKRLLNFSDYELLYKIDLPDSSGSEHSDQSLNLLYNLAILEYNSYWWMSHPVIRTLPEYKKQRAD